MEADHFRQGDGRPRIADDRQEARERAPGARRLDGDRDRPPAETAEERLDEVEPRREEEQYALSREPGLLQPGADPPCALRELGIGPRALFFLAVAEESEGSLSSLLAVSKLEQVNQTDHPVCKRQTMQHAGQREVLSSRLIRFRSGLLAPLVE